MTRTAAVAAIVLAAAACGSTPERSAQSPTETTRGTTPASAAPATSPPAAPPTGTGSAAPAPSGQSPASTPLPTPTPTSAPTATPAPATAEPAIDRDADPRVIARRAKVPVLCYHQLRDWTGDDSESARPYILPPASFRRQLDALDRWGYTTITPDQLVAHLTTGAELPPKPVLLTFDDGDDTHFSVALPELRKRGMTGTFFIMTVVLDKPGYVTTGQVRRLHRAGMTIGSHTWDHHRVDRYSGDDWRIQIREPAKELREIIDAPVRYFAYPFGVWGSDAFRRLDGAGFVAAFQLNSEPLHEEQPLYTLRRAIASPYWSSGEFRSALRRS